MSKRPSRGNHHDSWATREAYVRCSGSYRDYEEPEYEGSLAECEEWVMDNSQDYLRPGVDHDLYMLEIIPV